MPMTKPEDFSGGDLNNFYCVHCADPDGNLKSYEEVLRGMAGFMIKSHNMDSEAAEIAAREYMSKMPAWRC